MVLLIMCVSVVVQAYFCACVSKFMWKCMLENRGGSIYKRMTKPERLLNPRWGAWLGRET